MHDSAVMQNVKALLNRVIKADGSAFSPTTQCRLGHTSLLSQRMVALELDLEPAGIEKTCCVVDVSTS